MNDRMGRRRCAGRSRSWQVGVLAAVAAAVAMLAVACGGGGGSPSQAGSSHPARSPIATKYASGWPGYEALLPVFGLLLLAVGIFVPGSLAQRASFIALWRIVR